MTQSRSTALSPRVVIGVYALMIMAAVLWGFFTGGPNVFFLPAADSFFPGTVGPYLRSSGFPAFLTGRAGAILLGTAAGAAVGALVVGSSRLAARHLRWVRDLQRGFIDVLGPLDRTTIAVAAIASALGEEALFRGAMLPTLGILLSSAIFGAVHIGPGRRFAAWPVMAFVMGLGFSMLATGFGNLAGPITAHFVINYFNLGHLSRAARDEPPPPAS